jgi:hypothetical protein
LLDLSHAGQHPIAVSEGPDAPEQPERPIR